MQCHIKHLMPTNDPCQHDWCHLIIVMHNCFLHLIRERESKTKATQTPCFWVVHAIKKTLGGASFWSTIDFMPIFRFPSSQQLIKATFCLIFVFEATSKTHHLHYLQHFCHIGHWGATWGWATDTPPSFKHTFPHRMLFFNNWALHLVVCWHFPMSAACQLFFSLWASVIEKETCFQKLLNNWETKQLLKEHCWKICTARKSRFVQKCMPIMCLLEIQQIVSQELPKCIRTLGVRLRAVWLLQHTLLANTFCEACVRKGEVSWSIGCTMVHHLHMKFWVTQSSLSVLE